MILNELVGQLEIQWSVGKPWYGMNWALRPAKARLLSPARTLEVLSIVV
jgi:hypothetical protein